MRKVWIALISFSLMVMLCVPALAGVDHHSLVDIFDSIGADENNGSMTDDLTVDGIFGSMIDLDMEAYYESLDDHPANEPVTYPSSEPVTYPSSEPVVEYYDASGAIDASFMDEVVLLDDDLCKVSITGFATKDQGNYDRFVASFAVENRSANRLNFSIDQVSLNDYMIHPTGYIGSLDPGQRVEEDMRFTLADLYDNGITNIKELAFLLKVRDADDIIYYEEKYFTILPYGRDIPDQPEQTFSESDIVLVDNEVLTMIVTGEPYCTEYTYFLPVYIENHTDKTVRVNPSYDFSYVNGCDVYTFMWDNIIPPGKKENTTFNWDISDLEEYGISNIESVELGLVVFDEYADWERIFEKQIFFALN